MAALATKAAQELEGTCGTIARLGEEYEAAEDDSIRLGCKWLPHPQRSPRSPQQATCHTLGSTPAVYSALHFVGFKDDRIFNARAVWGEPDFYHRFHDHRAVCEFAPGDVVIFADEPGEVREHAFDDSANQ